MKAIAAAALVLYVPDEAPLEGEENANLCLHLLLSSVRKYTWNVGKLCKLDSVRSRAV